MYLNFQSIHNINGDIMNKRYNDYYYKSCDIDKMCSLDKKRYEYLNEYGYNIDCNSKRIIDYEMRIKRHKNSESK